MSDVLLMIHLRCPACFMAWTEAHPTLQAATLAAPLAMTCPRCAEEGEILSRWIQTTDEEGRPTRGRPMRRRS